MKRIRSFMASYWFFSSSLACSKSAFVCSSSSCLIDSSSSSVDSSIITFTSSASSSLISPRSCSCCSCILLISPCFDFKLCSASFFFCSASDFLSAMATVNWEKPMATTSNAATNFFDFMYISSLDGFSMSNSSMSNIFYAQCMVCFCLLNLVHSDYNIILAGWQLGNGGIFWGKIGG